MAATTHSPDRIEAALHKLVGIVASDEGNASLIPIVHRLERELQDARQRASEYARICAMAQDLPRL